jgi:hypothetical protein
MIKIIDSKNLDSGKIIDTKDDGAKKQVDPILKGRSTLQLKSDELGNNYVSFTFTEGKGTSSQPVSIDNFDEIISALSFYRDNGIPKRKENSKMTDVEFLHASIEEIDGIVEFRTYGGRGAKPTRFPKDRFDDVINFLKNDAKNYIEKNKPDISEEITNDDI